MTQLLAMSWVRGGERRRKIKVFDQTFSEKFCLIFFLVVCVCLPFGGGDGDGGSFKTVTSFSSHHGCVRIQCQSDNLHIEDSVLACNSHIPHATRCICPLLAPGRGVCAHDMSYRGDKRVREKCHESITWLCALLAGRGCVFVWVRARSLASCYTTRISLKFMLTTFWNIAFKLRLL